MIDKNTTEDGKYKRDLSNPGSLVSKDYEGLKAYKLRKAKASELASRVDKIENMLDLILSELKRINK